MKLFERMNRYLVDNEYSIIYKNGSVCINNYKEVLDFSSTRVVILYDGGKSVITGVSLVVSRMEDNEVLIVGKIKGIEV